MPRSLVPNTFDYSGVYVEGKRSYFNFNKPYLASFMSGMFIPAGDPVFVIPGAKADLVADMVIRSGTMVVPPLDGIYIDTFCVWTPFRILMTNFPQFLGENDTTAWTQNLDLVLPNVYSQTISNSLWSDFDADNINDIDLANIFLSPHFGLFVPKELTKTDAIYNVPINVLAYRGYYATWNHFVRDENYQRPVLFSKGNTGSAGEFGYFMIDYKVIKEGYSLSDVIQIQAGEGAPIQYALMMPVNKFHDWSTSVLPQAQFGNPVEFGLSGQAEIKLDTDLVSGLQGNQPVIVAPGLDSINDLPLYADNGWLVGDTGSGYEDLWINPNGSLYADLSTASAVTVNTLRSAIMLQRYLEALGRGGRRVVEMYENIYGVKNSVAAKDYPICMSRQRYPLGVNQVIATADGSGEGWSSHLGDTGAYSLTSLRNVPMCRGEFTEFGYLYFFYCVRADNRYSCAIPKHFTYQTLLDFYNPYFDHIGEVDVPNYLVNSLAKAKGNFGYQEAWFEERTQVGITVGSLNKQYGSESYWVLGDVFDENLVTCTPAYLCFNPAVFNDVFTAEYQLYPQFKMDMRIHGRSAKRMSLHSTPGIVGRI